MHEIQAIYKEISFLKTVFGKMNGFPSRVVNNTVEEVKRKMDEERKPPENDVSVDSTLQGNAERTEEEIAPFICLPYKGKAGDKIISQFRDAVRKALPNNAKPRFAYKGKKLGSYFRLKDKIPLEHQTDLVYAFRPENSTEYVGETNVRFGTRTHEHCNTDKNSSVYKYKQENQLDISQDDFVILDKGYSKKLNRKLAEALYIKELKPVLNEQVKSYKLVLFN